MKDDESKDLSRACFACDNMEAYWAEKARRDPALRERILELQRLRATVEQGAPAVDGERAVDPGVDGPNTV